MKGQGLVEYALILVLVAIVVVVIITMLGDKLTNDNPCYGHDDRSYECLKYQVEQCVIDEQYTREECIALIGGGK